MNARDIMRDASPVSPSTPVGEVARQLLDTNGGGVAVMEGGKLVGWITATELVAKHASPHLPIYLGILGFVVPFETRDRDEEVRRVLAVSAGDLMETEFQSVAPDTDVQEVATLILDERLDAVPVIENGSLLGMIGKLDLVRLVVLEESENGISSTGPL